MYFLVDWKFDEVLSYLCDAVLDLELKNFKH